MEVHHHPIAIGSHTARKKWAHYFWEFFMLFLAVTLGFFVENQREHYVEHRHEKRYMHMMIDDLLADRQEIDRVDSSRQAREKKLDSLIWLLGEKNNPENIATIYRLTLITDAYESFLRNDRTIQEMKSAGGMRTIRNKIVSGAIMKYDNFIISEVDWNNKTEASRIDYYKQIRFQLLNATVLNNITSGRKDIQFKLLPASPLTINIITGALFQVKRISETCRESDRIAKRKIEKLIELIRKEYHIK